MFCKRAQSIPLSMVLLRGHSEADEAGSTYSSREASPQSPDTSPAPDLPAYAEEAYWQDQHSWDTICRGRTGGSSTGCPFPSGCWSSMPWSHEPNEERELSVSRDLARAVLLAKHSLAWSQAHLSVHDKSRRSGLYDEKTISPLTGLVVARVLARTYAIWTPHHVSLNLVLVSRCHVSPRPYVWFHVLSFPPVESFRQSCTPFSSPLEAGALSW